MIRFTSLSGWFFTCLGFALMVVSALAVPPNAFADAGSDCAEYCSSQPPGSPEEYWQCLADCCSWDEACCQSACDGGTECMDGCTGTKCLEVPQSRACDDKCYLRLKVVDKKLVIDCYDGGTGKATCLTTAKCKACQCKLIITEVKGEMVYECFCTAP